MALAACESRGSPGEAGASSGFFPTGGEEQCHFVCVRGKATSSEGASRPAVLCQGEVVVGPLAEALSRQR